MVFFITLALLLSAGVVLMPVHVYAQRNVTIMNPSFEKPDSGKIEGFEGKTTHTGTGFKVLVVPGWHVNAPDSSVFDSGIDSQSVATNGDYVAYLMGGDSAIYQNLNRRLASDDKLKLTVDAEKTYLGTSLKMELYYHDGDSAAGAIIPIVSDTKTITTTMTAYSITVDGSVATDAQGYKIGILLQNVTAGPHSWMYIDNVRLTNEDSTIIEVPNYSFEQPDSGKIEGWNGPGSCSKIADSQADIPGWASDSTVIDSGLEKNSDGGDGQYAGFLAWEDGPVWNTTDYSIQAGDIITLRVNARASWIADMIHYELYYDSSSVKHTITYDEQALDPTGATWTEYSLQFSADAMPTCIGNKIGVSLRNPSTVSNSWANVDMVRLNANHGVVGVSRKQLKPVEFAIGQNYPNPFNPSTQISYTVGQQSFVTLKIYDILGREVATLVNEVKPAGTHLLTWNAAKLGSGVYFYKMQAGSFSATKKMLLIK